MAICVMDDVLEHSPVGGAKYAPQVSIFMPYTTEPRGTSRMNLA